MSLFDNKKKKVIDVDGKKVELQPKPTPFSGLFGKKQTQQTTQQNPLSTTSLQQASSQQSTTIPGPQVPQSPSTNQPSIQQIKKFANQQQKQRASMSGPSSFKNRLEDIGRKKKGLEGALREQGVKTSMYQFVRNMLVAAAVLGLVIGITIIILFQHIGLDLAPSVILGGLLGVVIAYMAFQTFLNFPMQKGKSSSKNIERDILFAARDMIISLRSGMPLFNAITSISTGYGDASKEFAKIVQRVQLGTPLEDAIDQTVSESRSISFRRIMLQAGVSIRAGADVVSALQSVIDQLSQERIIELRRYGQRLNAIAMFYMLFGIILPSMGIAVVTILTTFIAIFTVNVEVLEFALVGIIFLQIVFLEMITSSRPVFSL
jgi:archaeal flagellar protein FlaJ